MEENRYLCTINHPGYEENNYFINPDSLLHRLHRKS